MLKKSKILLFITFSFLPYSNSYSEDLIDIHPGFYNNSTAKGVTSNGSIVYGTSYQSSSNTIFSYDGTSYTDLSSTIGLSNIGFGGISDDGSTLALSYSSQAYKYKSGTLTALGYLSGGNFSEAYGISGDGSTILGYANNSSNEYHGFYYTDSSGIVDMGTLGGNSSISYQSSYNGSIIVGYSTNASNYYRAYYYTKSNNTMYDIGTFSGTGGNNSYAYDISGNGNTVVGESSLSGDSIYHAFSYTIGGNMTDLGTLGGDNSAANAVNYDGTIIVGSAQNSSGQYNAFKYTASGGMVNLGTLTGGTNSSAIDISSDGTVIVGRSLVTGGTYHAFIYNNTVENATLVDVNNTYSALYINGKSLSALMNLKSALVRSNLDQECNKFGKNGLCIGTGYRYSNINQRSTTQQAANLQLGYLVNPHLKIGMMLDQDVETSNPTNFTLHDYKPTASAYAIFNENADNQGFTLKLAGLYSNNTATITRTTLNDTEAGLGNAKMSTRGLLAEASYTKDLSDNLVIKPFAGLRQTQVSRGSYTETQGASFPISYNKITQKLNTASLGLRALEKLNTQLSVFYGAGYEINFNSKVNGYSAYNSTLGDFNLVAPTLHKNNGFANVGLNYDLKENQRVSASFYYGKQALINSNSAMAYLTYYVGF